MRVLLAPDKFKGTLTAAQVAAAVGEGVVEAATHVGVPVVVTAVPVADGGDGTLAAAVAAGYEAVPVTVTGPDGAPVTAAWARGAGSSSGEAVVELAAASGLVLLRPDALRPLTATSRGTGELVRAALDAGCRRVVLGIGGSASTDGGAGMVAALGGRLLDADGHEVADGGAALSDAVRLDLSGLHPGLREAQLVVACDVDRPLTGPSGAAAVFGPQKGAGPDDVRVLDAALAHWADLVAAANHPTTATTTATTRAPVRPGASASPPSRCSGRGSSPAPPCCSTSPGSATSSAASAPVTSSSPARGRSTRRPCTARPRPRSPTRPAGTACGPSR